MTNPPVYPRGYRPDTRLMGPIRLLRRPDGGRTGDPRSRVCAR